MGQGTGSVHVNVGGITTFTGVTVASSGFSFSASTFCFLELRFSLDELPFERSFRLRRGRESQLESLDDPDSELEPLEAELDIPTGHWPS